MKKRLFAIGIFLLIAFTSIAQEAVYQVLKDPKDSTAKMLKGNIFKYTISADSSFSWYKPNHDNYTPDSATVAQFAAAKDSVKFLLFGGTWCEDTQFILPRFFKLQELSGVPDNAVIFWAVDRDKKTLDGMAEQYNIVNVPTIIIIKHNKEIGRVVEYGKTGNWDKELATILAEN